MNDDIKREKAFSIPKNSYNEEPAKITLSVDVKSDKEEQDSYEDDEFDDVAATPRKSSSNSDVVATSRKSSSSSSLNPDDGVKALETFVNSSINEAKL